MRFLRGGSYGVSRTFLPSSESNWGVRLAWKTKNRRGVRKPQCQMATIFHKIQDINQLGFLKANGEMKYGVMKGKCFAGF